MDLFSNHGIFKNLLFKTLKTLYLDAEICDYKKLQTVYKENDRADYFYLIKTGEFEVGFFLKENLFPSLKIKNLKK